MWSKYRFIIFNTKGTTKKGIIYVKTLINAHKSIDKFSYFVAYNNTKSKKR